MNTQLRPGALMMIGGGVLLFIGSLLDWHETGFGLGKSDLMGIQWLFTLVIGLGAAVLVAIRTFANVDLPDRVIGYTWNQIIFWLGIAAFIIGFGGQFGESREIGITLVWIAAAVMVAGAFMESQGESASSGSGGTPTTF